MTTLSIDNALKTVADKFSFSVDKFPLYGPDNMATPHFGLFKSDTMECVGKTVSARYVPHTTEDILAITEAAAEAFDGEIDARCHFRDGHYVEFRPTTERRQELHRIGGDDSIWPRFMVKGGYDGRGFSATIGYFRDACSNMAMISSVDSFRTSIRHTSGLRGEMDDLITSFAQLKQEWTTLTDLLDNMAAVKVDMRAFLNEIYPEPADDARGRAVTVHRNRTEAIIKRLAKEQRQLRVDSDLHNPSLWLAYNAVQGYEQHDATRRKAFNNPFDRVLKANGSQAVREAEKLALEMVA